MDVANSKEPCVVIAASGMLTGDRILNHLKTTLEDSNSSFIFIGYQAEGTLGREMMEGEKKVEIDNEEYEVKLGVSYIPGLSAHADAEGLFSFLNSAKILPKKIFVVHGEPWNAGALRERIIKHLRLRIDTFVPDNGYVENFMVREIVKVEEKDVHLDFTPGFTKIWEYEVAPFAGALLKKQDSIHLISEEQYMEILDEAEEHLEKSLEKLEEEGCGATIAHINKLAGKERLYPQDRDKQEKLRKALVVV